MTKLLKAIATIGFLAMTSIAFADTVTYTGNTETSADGSWMRPNVMFTAVDADTTLYSVQSFTVSADGMYDISSIQGDNSLGSQFDGMILLYSGTFDPMDPLSGGIAADDDDVGGPGTSAIMGASLSAGTTYYLITTGFSAEDTVFGAGSGPFTNTISGDGDVMLGSQVPVPAALWLMLSGLAGLRIWRRS